MGRITTGYHFGVDFFARNDHNLSSSTIYSVGDNGLIVGIGVSRKVNTQWIRDPVSAATWGSAVIGQVPGYTVVVRYGHLDVLYGHLRELSPTIYVGKKVMAGDRIGLIGTFISTDGTVSSPHLHLEIRSFGQIAPDSSVAKAFVKTFENQNNSAGILKYEPSQAKYLYDVTQFFKQSSNPDDFPVSAFPDDQSLQRSIGVSGLGKTLEAGGEVRLLLSDCQSMTYIALQDNTAAPKDKPYPNGITRVNGYRSLIMGIGLVRSGLLFDPLTISQPKP